MNFGFSATNVMKSWVAYVSMILNNDFGIQSINFKKVTILKIKKKIENVVGYVSLIWTQKTP